MVSNFENSEQYKKALQEYQKKIYNDILHPINSIVVDYDEVYLFYDQKNCIDIHKKMVELYNDEDNDFPFSLGYETPKIVIKKIMNIEYKSIRLWYDKCDVPEIFKAKI